MSTEAPVTLVFFLVLLAGVVLLVLGLARRRHSPKAIRWQGAGLMLIGLANLELGLMTQMLVQSSERPEVTGTIWDVRQETDSAKFRISTTVGTTVSIRCKCTGVDLGSGAYARVRYIEYNGRLLEMTLLQGPSAGQHAEEPYRLPGASVYMFSAFFLFSGYLRWRHAGPVVEPAD